MMNGKCMCGAVKVAGEPSQASMSACHCDMCRRWCGGPFIAVQMVHGSTEISGPAKRVQTSDWAERAFCSECGSTLWYRMTDEADRSYNFAAGLFETGDMPIALEVWIDEKPSGYAFAGARKQMTGPEVLAIFEPDAQPNAQGDT